MGRRSRKRVPSPAPDRPVPARPPASRRRRDERPRAPWGNFPLVELCVLIALVIGVAGFVTGGNRGGIMLAAAAALGSLAGLELAIREHFAGYRSHTTVLAAAPAVVAMGVLFFAAAPRVAMLGAGIGVFALAFWGLRELFRRRSGGYGFR